MYASNWECMCVMDMNRLCTLVSLAMGLPRDELLFILLTNISICDLSVSMKLSTVTSSSVIIMDAGVAVVVTIPARTWCLLNVLDGGDVAAPEPDAIALSSALLLLTLVLFRIPPPYDNFIGAEGVNGALLLLLLLALVLLLVGAVFCWSDLFSQYALFRYLPTFWLTFLLTTRSN